MQKATEVQENKLRNLHARLLDYNKRVDILFAKLEKTENLDRIRHIELEIAEIREKFNRDNLKFLDLQAEYEFATCP